MPFQSITPKKIRIKNTSLLGGTPEISTPEPKQGLVGKIFDVAQAPLHAVAGYTEAALTGNRSPLSAAFKGLTLKEKKGFSDVLGAAGVQDPLTRGVGGFIGDVVFDPLNLVSFGGKTVLGKTAKALTELNDIRKLQKEATIAGNVGKFNLGKLAKTAAERENNVAKLLKISRAEVPNAERVLNSLQKGTLTKKASLFSKISTAPQTETFKTLEKIAEIRKGKSNILSKLARGQNRFVQANVLGKEIVPFRKTQEGLAKAIGGLGDLTTKLRTSENPLIRSAGESAAQKLGVLSSGGEALRKLFGHSSEYEAIDAGIKQARKGKDIAKAGQIAEKIATQQDIVNVAKKLGRSPEEIASRITYFAEKPEARIAARGTEEAAHLEPFVKNLKDAMNNTAKADSVIKMSNIRTGPRFIISQLDRSYKLIDSVNKKLAEKGVGALEKQRLQGFLNRTLSREQRALEKQSGVIDYATHILTDEAKQALNKTNTYKGISNDISDIHGSLLARDLPNKSIDEINKLAAEGKLEIAPGVKIKKFFHDDPSVIAAVRNLRSENLRLGNNYIGQMRERFGQQASRAPKDWVEIKGFEAGKGFKFPPEVAQRMDEVIKVTSSPQEIKDLLHVMTSIDRIWKPWVFVAPSYHVRNFISGIFQNYLAGMKGSSALKSYADAAALLDVPFIKKTLNKSKFVLETKTGRKYTTDEILQLAKQRGVIGINQTSTLYDDIGDALTTGFGKQAQTISDNSITRLNRQFGQSVENTSRLANFIDGLKQGLSVDDAVKRVDEFLFDYTSLTPAERNIQKFVPFYAWMRLNTPSMVYNLIKQPTKFTLLSKGSSAVEEAADTKGVSKALLPDFLQQGIPMLTSRLGDRVTAIDIAQFFPIGGLNMLDPSQIAKNFGGALSPTLRAPIELGTNYSFFSGQPIERFAGEKGTFLGLGASKKTEYLLRQARPLAELNRLNPFGVFGEGEGRATTGKERLGKALFGSASTPVDLKKEARTREFERRKLQGTLSAFITKLEGDLETAKGRSAQLKRQQLENLQKNLAKIKGKKFGEIRKSNKNVALFKDLKPKKVTGGR